VRRLVLDTNVLVSAYGFGGNPADLMRAIIEGEYQLSTSPALLAELADKLYTVLGFDDEHVRAVVAQLARIAEVVRPQVTLHVVADEPDNRVLECSHAGAADAIVSGDHHLLDLGEHGGVPILRLAALSEL
jgi:putative PIN family toxin of toxin-antitoxin system